MQAKAGSTFPARQFIARYEERPEPSAVPAFPVSAYLLVVAVLVIALLIVVVSALLIVR